MSDYNNDHFTPSQREAIKRQEAPFWETEFREKMSDSECILQCLKNCEQTAGLDKKQVQRMIKEFEGAQVRHLESLTHSGKRGKMIMIEYGIDE